MAYCIDKAIEKQREKALKEISLGIIFQSDTRECVSLMIMRILSDLTEQCEKNLLVHIPQERCLKLLRAFKNT